MPKRNGVRALWKSDDPLWRTRYFTKVHFFPQTNNLESGFPIPWEKQNTSNNSNFRQLHLIQFISSNYFYLDFVVVGGMEFKFGIFDTLNSHLQLCKFVGTFNSVGNSVSKISSSWYLHFN